MNASDFKPENLCEGIDMEDLTSGDLYRELNGSPINQVIRGTLAQLLADPTEHADATIWRQIGCGQDSHRERVAAYGT